MKKIGLLLRDGIPEAKKLAAELVQWCKDRDLKLALHKEAQGILGIAGESCSREELVRSCDPIVVLGGDGTLISLAPFVERNPPVMLGVNFGRLGFLTEVAPAELFPVLEAVLSGKAPLGERSMLQCEVIASDGKPIFVTQAINDVVVHKGALDRLPEIELAIDGESVTRMRADGLIVATPTGSTAYSLAAGGSIVHPQLAVILITPICPHSLTNRPFILDQDKVVEIKVPLYEGRLFVSPDGQSGREIQAGDLVRITRAKNRVVFVRSPSKSYFTILREKLGWGAPHGG